MSTTERMNERIGDLIEETLMVDVPGSDVDLVEAGLIDSLALISLITEIESRFGIQLPLEELDPESFRTVEAIAAYAVSRGADPS